VKLQAGLDGLAAARALRAELRMRGQDPAASDAAKAKLHDTLRRRRAEESAWDRHNPQVFDPAVFLRDVLPLIQAVSVRRLAAMTGLSVGYCALIRRGLRTPHPRWWEVLTEISAGDRSTDGSLTGCNGGMTDRPGVCRTHTYRPLHALSTYYVTRVVSQGL
jgi:hypothetical protein